MDSFMSYKALYKQVSDQMFQVRQKTMEIMSWEKKDAADAAQNTVLGETSPKPTSMVAVNVAKSSVTKSETNPKKDGFYPFVKDNTRFDAIVGGLDQARKAIRRQMSRIVNEVDAIEGDPKLATDEGHNEPFQPPASFEVRLPTVDIPERLRPKENPLTGQHILAKTLTEEERKKEAKRLEALEKAPSLYREGEAMEPDEAAMFAKYIEIDPSVGYHLNATAEVGAVATGDSFNNLEFIREDWQIRLITMISETGIIDYITVEYENGLIVRQGVVSLILLPSGLSVPITTDHANLDASTAWFQWEVIQAGVIWARREDSVRLD